MSEGPVSRAEHQKLAREVVELRARVAELSRLVATLQADVELRSEFELVGEPLPVPSVAAVTAVEAPAPTRSVNGIPVERLALAQSIGRWVKRCLRGEHRGLSGREKVNLQSRVYLVFRGVDCTVFNPPQVFFTLCEAKPFCKTSAGPGDSVYIGLPSKTEAVEVINAAELEIPTALR